MKLDKFHYHEALHTTHVIQMMIIRELIEHPVGFLRNPTRRL